MSTIGWLKERICRLKQIALYFRNSDFKFGMQLRFAKAHHEIPLEEKWAWP